LRTHIEAEVFAGNALVVATVAWLAAGPLRGARRAAALGLVGGLGMANHLTCSLVTPLGILGVVRALRETEEPRWRVALAGACGLALGLSAYVYLVIADGPASYGEVNDAGDVLAFFLREDFGGATAFAAGGRDVSAWTSLLALAETLGRGLLWLPALGGVVVIALRCARGEQRTAWISFALSLLLTGPLLALRFNLPPTGIDRYVVERFHLLPLLLITIPAALALAPLAARMSKPVATAVGAASFIVLVLVAWPRVRALHSPAVERGVLAALEPAPPNAILVVGSDELCFGLQYLQHVRGVRTDVTAICWPLSDRPWYRDRLIARGVPMVLPYTRSASPEQADAWLATGRPLLVDRGQTGILASRVSYPHGITARVVASQAAAPTLREVLELNERIYAGFDLDYPPPGDNDDFATGAHVRYAATWFLLAKALAAAGDQDAAAQAQAIAKRLAPVRAEGVPP
jgi:hypothetical protein